MIHAWIHNGLLYVVREGDSYPHPQHAVFVENNVFWIQNGSEGECQPLLDIEKHQINAGRAWPPPEAAISL